jgi:hypothetical protein
VEQTLFSFGAWRIVKIPAAPSYTIIEQEKGESVSKISRFVRDYSMLTNRLLSCYDTRLFDARKVVARTAK